MPSGAKHRVICADAQRRMVDEYRVKKVTQRDSGFDAEFLIQPFTHATVGAQGHRLLPGPVERDHQLLAKTLIQ